MLTIGRRPDIIFGIGGHRGVELSGLVCESGGRSAHLARFGGRLSASRLSSGIKGASFVIPSICSSAPTPARLPVFCVVPSTKDMMLIGLAGLLLLCTGIIVVGGIAVHLTTVIALQVGFGVVFAKPTFRRYVAKLK